MLVGPADHPRGGGHVGLFHSRRRRIERGQQQPGGFAVVRGAGRGHGAPQPVAIGHQPRRQPFAQRGHDGRTVGVGNTYEGGQTTGDARRLQADIAAALSLDLGNPLLLASQFAAQAIELPLGVAGRAAQFLQAGDLRGAGAALFVAAGQQPGGFGLGGGDGRFPRGDRRLIRSPILGRGIFAAQFLQPQAQLSHLALGLGQRGLRLSALGFGAGDLALPRSDLRPALFIGDGELLELGLAGLAFTLGFQQVAQGRLDRGPRRRG